MELPATVLIHNQTLGLKGSPGNLLSISPHGYYEVNLSFGEKVHRVLFPVASTVVIHQQAEDAEGTQIEVER